MFISEEPLTIAIYPLALQTIVSFKDRVKIKNIVLSKSTQTLIFYQETMIKSCRGIKFSMVVNIWDAASGG